jgi:hypothetical protein
MENCQTLFNFHSDGEPLYMKASMHFYVYLMSNWLNIYLSVKCSEQMLQRK